MLVALAMVGLSIPAAARSPPSTDSRIQANSTPPCSRTRSTAAHRRQRPHNLGGVWGYAGYTSDIAKDYDVGEVPMTPLADKLFKERQAHDNVGSALSSDGRSSSRPVSVEDHPTAESGSDSV